MARGGRQAKTNTVLGLLRKGKCSTISVVFGVIVITVEAKKCEAEFKNQASHCFAIVLVHILYSHTCISQLTARNAWWWCVYGGFMKTQRWADDSMLIIYTYIFCHALNIHFKISLWPFSSVLRFNMLPSPSSLLRAQYRSCLSGYAWVTHSLIMFLTHVSPATLLDGSSRRIRIE
jgi:hypothetical protein